MKKVWENASIVVLDISETANGMAPADSFDGPWQEMPDGTWWRPGDGDLES